MKMNIENKKANKKLLSAEEYEVIIGSYFKVANQRLTDSIKALMVGEEDLESIDIKVVKRKKDELEYIVYITKEGKVEVAYNSIYKMPDTRPKAMKINAVLTSELLRLIEYFKTLN